jgi:hypothetical protein
MNRLLGEPIHRLGDPTSSRVSEQFLQDAPEVWQ